MKPTQKDRLLAYLPRPSKDRCGAALKTGACGLRTGHKAHHKT